MYNTSMSDPIRIKKEGEIVMRAAYKDNEEVIFHLNVDRDEVKKIPKDILQNRLLEELKKVSITYPGGMTGINTVFSYSEPDFLKEFNYANTLIEINLPYCLHIPNNYEIEVNIPEINLKANIIFEKIWTQRANDEKEPSDNIDFFAEDRDIYLNNSSMITPRMPLRPREGWEGYFTGKNIEKIKDQGGIFRYTKLLIQFNTNTPKESIRNDSSVIEDVRGKVLTIVNRIIDIYRTQTNEYYVRRLGDVNITMIYFIEHGYGYYILSPNTVSAKINISKIAVEKIEEKLLNNEPPELYKLLLLNAKSSLDTKDHTLAIVESFQGLEIFLENYLIKEFKKRGDAENDYRKILKDNWRTKDRLKSVLKNLKGKSLGEESSLWSIWFKRYDETRNEVLHGGKEPSISETKETLDINEKVITWVEGL